MKDEPCVLCGQDVFHGEAHRADCPVPPPPADDPPRSPAQLSVRDVAIGLTREDLPRFDGVPPLVGDALL